MTGLAFVKPLISEGALYRCQFGAREKMMNQAVVGRDVLTLREVAAILRCSKTHVSNVINGKVGGVPTLTHVRMGRRIMIRSVWLHDWMETNKVSASI